MKKVEDIFSLLIKPLASSNEVEVSWLYLLPQPRQNLLKGGFKMPQLLHLISPDGITTSSVMGFAGTPLINVSVEGGGGALT
jgi:hypothetical protein